MNIIHQVFHCLQHRQLIKTENKNDIYRGKDCMKKICESLGERAIKIIN